MILTVDLRRGVKKKFNWFWISRSQIRTEPSKNDKSTNEDFDFEQTESSYMYIIGKEENNGNSALP